MPEDKIGKSLGLEPIETFEGEIVDAEDVAPQQDEESENDYKYARQNFYSVIENGTKALEDMLDVAKASEHPRAYEVVSTLMKTLIDANKDLVNLSEKRKEETEDSGSVTNNNLFVGSTEQLQKMLKNMRDSDK
jgi:hypothetical protein